MRKIETSDDSSTKWVAFSIVTVTCLAILGILRPDLILTVNTPSGGDMGAHVLGPALLRDVLIPSGRILGWSDAWFAGFPAFYFYFPLPSLVIVALDVILPYGVAFKIVTVCGLVATPIATYALARSMKLSQIMAALAAVGGGLFVLFENFTIYGANAPSTLAGEFAFSWSFALGLWYLSLLIRAVHGERRLFWAAAFVLGLTALSHVITTIVFVIGSLAVMAWKRAAPAVIGSWAVGLSVAGFWAIPLLASIRYTADMAWSPLHAWDELFPTEIWMMGFPALIGVIWLVIKTSRVGPLLLMAVTPLIYFWLPTLASDLEIFDGTWKLWNGRLLPFWFYGVAFSAGVGVAVIGRTLARRLPTTLSVWSGAPWFFGLAGISAGFIPQYPEARSWAIGLASVGAVWLVAALSATMAQNEMAGTFVSGGVVLAAGIGTATALIRDIRGIPLVVSTVILVGSVTWLVAGLMITRARLDTMSVVGLSSAMTFLAIGLAGVSFISGWARWNFTGYEGKSDFSEYSALMDTLEELPPGRVQWEANRDLDKYGTPMALMLTSYWSETHPSMEGLFFESSLTTPFHFLNAGELSRNPSNPIPGLNYHTFDFDRGIAHMEKYGVTYYVAFTPDATAAAQDHVLLTEVASSPPFTIYTFPESDMVEVAQFQPSVYERAEQQETFHEISLEWYDNLETLDFWLTEDGPSDWPRVAELDQLPAEATAFAGGGEVSDVVVDNGTISFHTTAVGVPHLVKVSYFPNWEATGALGPYRASPSLMVVVPTSENVTMEFARQWPELLGNGLTLVTLLGFGSALIFQVVRKRRSAPEQIAS